MQIIDWLNEEIYYVNGKEGVICLWNRNLNFLKYLYIINYLNIL